MRNKLQLLIASLLVFNSCDVVLDQSALAIDAQDQTLVHTACKAAPSGGLDICRVVQGTIISEEWILIVPHVDKFISGELQITFKDQIKTYSINDSVIHIPWSDIVGHTTWGLDDSVPVQALGRFQYEGKTGPIFIDILGTAFLLVLKQGYAPLSIDSGAQMSSQDCKIQYSSAGRSAINCK